RGRSRNAARLRPRPRAQPSLLLPAAAMNPASRQSVVPSWRNPLRRVPHGQPSHVEFRLDCPYRSEPIVQNACNERRVRTAVQQDVAHMPAIAGTSGRDHRNRHDFGHGTRERNVVSSARAITVDTRQQNLAGASPRALGGPLDCVESGAPASAMRVNFPSYAAVCLTKLRVDARHNALRTETLCALL